MIRSVLYKSKDENKPRYVPLANEAFFFSKKSSSKKISSTKHKKLFFFITWKL